MMLDINLNYILTNRFTVRPYLDCTSTKYVPVLRYRISSFFLSSDPGEEDDLVIRNKIINPIIIKTINPIKRNS